MIILTSCVIFFMLWTNYKKKEVRRHPSIKSQPALVDNTSTRPASYSTKDFKSVLFETYSDVYKNLNFKQKPTFYVIPGLIQSAAIKYTPPNQGQPGIAYDMDPQGLAIIHHKYLIISAYSKSKTFDSVLWILDFKTGRFIKTIALNNIDHVGGITYDDDHDRLWVATINQYQRAQVQSLSLKELERYNFKKQKRPIKFKHGTNLAAPLKTSYLTYHKNKIYVGYFDKIHGGQLFGYKLNKKGLFKKDKNENDLAIPDENWSTYSQIQGISFDRKDILLSESYGDFNSQLLVFRNNLNKPNYNLDLNQADKTIILPPYLEQIIGKDGDVYLLFESATALYRQNPNLVHMDRVIKLKVKYNDGIISEK
ncbi:hypothetical protein CBF60_02640 [Lactobacillus taiwanensis]|nr:hypothetical protein CBF76_05390 [Lactobacillus taiwanensis]OYS23935.1 hypothetical protein CBF55_04315 [Lactobacillus taiwanensis]OYS24570.1 hypothetical protein CBF73_06375 [Lactobacillus taiwanensis]OYS25270.1 hypothetical protein CBF66_03115 [Lactobacillus taiwanensis]OYS29009.1 hypothetical protein CBF60_02640 [Lactobacillus taiwanensis]